MSDTFENDDMNDVSKAAMKNPKVDAKKVLEARELLRVLREQGVSRPRYRLILPYTRQMHVESEHEGAKS